MKRFSRQKATTSATDDEREFERLVAARMLVADQEDVTVMPGFSLFRGRSEAAETEDQEEALSREA
jgi:hypothetical protein